MLGVYCVYLRLHSFVYLHNKRSIVSKRKIFIENKSATRDVSNGNCLNKHDVNFRQF